jgi:hypothetical protein
MSCGDEEPERFPQEAEPDTGIWVTFLSEGEQFQAVVVQPAEVERVLRWASTGDQQRELSGQVSRTQAFNAPYSWSLIPDTVSFAEVQPQIPDECRTQPSEFERSQAWTRCVFYSPRDVQILTALDCRSGTCVLIGQPRPTPTSTVTASPTPTVTVTASPTSTPSPTPTVTSSPTPTPTVTVTTTPSPSPSPSPSPTPYEPARRCPSAFGSVGAS